MSDEEYPLILKAAWYYYMEDYTQQQISQMLGVSRAKVIRLLEEARAEGVIQFIFRAEDSSRMQIERGLIERFGLDDAYVIPTPGTSSDLSDSLARAAAMYVSDHLRADGYLNIGYGDTMSLVLNHLAVGRSGSLNVVSLTGGVSYYLPKISSEIFGMRLYLTPAPLVVSSRDLRDALLEEQSIRDVYRMTEHADMSLVGIGGAEDNATVLRNGILSKTELALLKMQGAVGDILTHFVDAHGQPIDTTIENRIVSTSLEDLRAMRNVVGVAAGPEKVAAIHAVLVAGYLNVLITDGETARSLLACQVES
ncbi:sugar-binding transcriptional regulator [Thermophilibacter sp.]